MNRLISKFGLSALTAIALAMTSSAGAAADKLVDPPPWLAQVPVLRSGDAQSFRFRAHIDMFGFHLIAYVSWAPPDHRSVILCDSSDGLPLAISVDGHAWIYDLVSGQILRSKDEFVFDLTDTGLNFGLNPSGVIHLDFASLFGRGPGDFHMAEDSRGRVVSLVSHRRTRLRVTSSNPPQPVAVEIDAPSTNPPGHLEFDAFRFGGPPPRWHHPLDISALAKDVPFYDMEDMKDLPQEKQKQMEVFKQLMLAGGSFLLRPAIHDPAARRKLEQLPMKINFDQIALHEKLLSKAWYRALERQGCDPATYALDLLAADETPKNADRGTARPEYSAGLNPAILVVDLGRLFAGHPDTEKAQRELTARADAEQEARKGEMETAAKIVGEAAALDKKLASPEVSEAEKKELEKTRAEMAAKVGQINERTNEYSMLTEKWKAARHDEIVEKIESSLHGLSNGKEAVVVLDKSASSSNKTPAVLFSSEGMDITDQALEAIRSGKPITPEVIKDAPRKVRVASVDLYKVFNSLNETDKVSDEISEVTRSSNAEIKERTDSLKALKDETNRLIREAQQAGPDDPQKEEKKKVLKEKARLLEKGDQEVKELEAARDRRYADINKSGLIRVPHEMQQAVIDLARAAGADLVLDSTGQSTSSTSMVFHLQGVPDWTESVIEKMNFNSPEAKAHGDAAANRTVSSEDLRFGVVNFQKVLGGVPVGEEFKRKDAEAAAKLKALAAKGDKSSASKEAIVAEGRALLDSIVANVNKAIATEEGNLDYNVIFETGGKSDNGAPLMLSSDRVPDLTAKAIKALSVSGQ